MTERGAARIYLDHAATTPTDPRVFEAMLPYLTETWGNPSSIYAEAQHARRALDQARRTVAEILGAKPNEIVFTSGGTESDTLALRGTIAALRDRHPGHAEGAPSPQGVGWGEVPHIIITTIEHHAVLHTVEQLQKDGEATVTHVPVDSDGIVDLDALRIALRPDTALVSIMYANNEVGSIQPIAEIASIVKAHNPRIVFHTDAVQAAGTLDLDVDRLGVDLLSIAAHKFYGPKGVGALYIRNRTPLAPQILGGSQERNRRAGTENVASIVGLATALQLAHDERAQNNEHLIALRDRLLTEIPRRIQNTIITGPTIADTASRAKRLQNSASFAFKHLEGEAVLLQLDLQGIAASSGSACTTASLEPSHVLVALGVPDDYLRGSLRLTLGHSNTMEDIDRVLGVLPDAVARIRNLQPAAGRA